MRAPTMVVVQRYGWARGRLAEKRLRVAPYKFSARSRQRRVCKHRRVRARPQLQVCVTALYARGCVWTVFRWLKHGREV